MSTHEALCRLIACFSTKMCRLMQVCVDSYSKFFHCIIVFLHAGVSSQHINDNNRRQTKVSFEGNGYYILYSKMNNLIMLEMKGLKSRRITLQLEFML